MDLNAPAPQPAYIEEPIERPQGRLRAVRLKSVEDLPDYSDLPDPSEFLAQPPIGEALPESEGSRVVLEGDDDYEQLLEQPESPLTDVSVAYDSLSKLLAQESDEIEQMVAKMQAEAAQYHTRQCPLPQCDSLARVPKDNADHGDVLGLGMSMNCAVALESLLLEHLEEHSLGEWMAALKKYEQALEAKYTAPAPAAGIVQAGVVPGPTSRSPEKQAAVDAMDRRLGGGGRAPVPEQDPAVVAEHDQKLRAARAARRAAQPSPYDLTPAWKQDQEAGVVGIKR